MKILPSPPPRGRPWRRPWGTSLSWRYDGCTTSTGTSEVRGQKCFFTVKVFFEHLLFSLKHNIAPSIAAIQKGQHSPPKNEEIWRFIALECYLFTQNGAFIIYFFELLTFCPKATSVIKHVRAIAILYEFTAFFSSVQFGLVSFFFPPPAVV